MKTLKIAYRCEFCGKLYERSKSCEKHEFYCFSNPVNRSACEVCEHASEFNKYSIWCKKHNKEYVMPSNLRPAFKRFNKISCSERMPLDCSDFEMQVFRTEAYNEGIVNEFIKEFEINPF